MRVVFQTFCALAILGSAANAGETSKAETSKVDPDSVAALDKMGAYLRTLSSFELKADTLTDNVLENGQTVQFAGTIDYKVRRPNGFVITVADDRKVRQFNYDGILAADCRVVVIQAGPKPHGLGSYC